MWRSTVFCLLVCNLVAAMAVAQASTPESNGARRYNQVFVKVIVPVTSRIPKQNGPGVESWVAQQLKQRGEADYLAVTDWVPVSDGLLADRIVDDRVWDGGKHYCSVRGGIPERENGRLLVNVSGWAPFPGYQANIRLPDEPGHRAVRPVQLLAGEEEQPVKTEAQLPYVAVIIAPPPQVGITSYDAE